MPKLNKATIGLIISVLLNVLGVFGIVPPAVPQPTPQVSQPVTVPCQTQSDAGVE